MKSPFEISRGGMPVRSVAGGELAVNLMRCASIKPETVSGQGAGEKNEGKQDAS